MNSNLAQSKVFVAGHNGMVGSSLVSALAKIDDITILKVDRDQLNLLDQAAVSAFLQNEKPDVVLIAAAKVGGISANNSHPADFIYENLMIECNLIHSSFLAGCKRLLFLGSSCIYPKFANQPICESELMTGVLEPSNEPYAVAKIAGIKLCESYNRQYRVDYRSVMPTNLYGPGDNFDPDNSHVIPGLIRKIHDANVRKLGEVKIWGTGRPLRDFLHVDDLARACIHILQVPLSDLNGKIGDQHSHINVGSDNEISIEALAHLLAEIIGFKGVLEFDQSMPDGTPRKLLDNSLIKSLGWNPEIDLNTGLKQVYAWYQQNML